MQIIFASVKMNLYILFLLFQIDGLFSQMTSLTSEHRSTPYLNLSVALSLTMQSG